MAGKTFKKRFPKSWVGKMVEVEWLDPAGYVQSELSRVKPCLCITNGILKSIRRDYIIVCSGYYPDDGKDPIVDATAITRGCVIKITLVQQK
tara:strand:+ start:194 stop:469 length:276 start_codon:yes stop_codon:yes gene_type:complete